MYKCSGIDDTVLSMASGPEAAVRTAILKRVIKPDSEKKDFDIKKRLLLAGIAGIGSAGIPLAVSQLIHKKNIVPMKYLIPLSLAAAATGYFAPEHINNIIDFHEHKDNDRLKMEEAPYLFSSQNIANKGREVSGVFENMSKQAAIFNEPVLGTIYKTLKSGLSFKKKTHIGDRLWGYGVKGAVAGAGLYGGYKGYKHLTAPRSGNDYTTFLRNNILAKNIDMSEIPEQDMRLVNELGMR